MLNQESPPFRAEHIGSLLRPAALREARRRFARQEIDQAALSAAEDHAIEEAVRLQERLGLRLATITRRSTLSLRRNSATARSRAAHQCGARRGAELTFAQKLGTAAQLRASVAAARRRAARRVSNNCPSS